MFSLLQAYLEVSALLLQVLKLFYLEVQCSVCLITHTLVEILSLGFLGLITQTKF